VRWLVQRPKPTNNHEQQLPSWWRVTDYARLVTRDNGIVTHDCISSDDVSLYCSRPCKMSRFTQCYSGGLLKFESRVSSKTRVSSIKNERIRCFLLIQLKLETQTRVLTASKLDRHLIEHNTRCCGTVVYIFAFYLFTLSVLFLVAFCQLLSIKE